mmetsp:Transcript_29544/g.51855  ORF Transcript_29544/g.51855 Transcript_29544/m.51855 type:complete len:121 (+) Transcript_29544:60-422(+)
MGGSWSPMASAYPQKQAPEKSWAAAKIRINGVGYKNLMKVGATDQDFFIYMHFCCVPCGLCGAPIQVPWQYVKETERGAGIVLDPFGVLRHITVAPPNVPAINISMHRLIFERSIKPYLR